MQRVETLDSVLLEIPGLLFYIICRDNEMPGFCQNGNSMFLSNW